MTAVVDTSAGRNALLVSAVALVSGGLLYLVLRPGALWFDPRPLAGSDLGFLANSLPAGLWMFSAAAAQLAVWSGVRGGARNAWLILTLALGIGWELAQKADWLAGTFDVADVVAALGGWLLAQASFGGKT